MGQVQRPVAATSRSARRVTVTVAVLAALLAASAGWHLSRGLRATHASGASGARHACEMFVRDRVGRDVSFTAGAATRRWATRIGRETISSWAAQVTTADATYECTLTEQATAIRDWTLTSLHASPIALPPDRRPPRART